EPSEMTAVEDDVKAFEKELLESLQRAEDALARGDQRRRLIGDLRRDALEYSAMRTREVIEPSRRGEKDLALKASVEVVGLPFDRVRKTVEDLIRLNVEQSELVYHDAKSGIELDALYALVLTALALLLSAAGALVISRDLAGRIGRLAAAAREVRDGRLETRPRVEG